MYKLRRSVDTFRSDYDYDYRLHLRAHPCNVENSAWKKFAAVPRPVFYEFLQKIRSGDSELANNEGTRFFNVNLPFFAYMLNFQMSLDKKKMFVWKEVHEKALITEILTVEPHQFKHGDKERGAAWTAIAERLNEMNMGFKVNQRSFREKFEKMMKDSEKKEREEKRAKWVSIQYSGIYRSVEDIKGRIAELSEVQQVGSQRKKKEKASAEEM